MIALALIGGLTLGSYAVLWLEPLWLGRFNTFAESATSVTVVLGRDASGALHFVAGLVVPMLLYAVALWLVSTRYSRGLMQVAVVAAVAAPLVLLYTYPVFAADVFDYLIQGRLVAHDGLNPYVYTATDVPGSPYYAPVGWKNLASVYGPVWVYITAAIVWVSGEHAVLALVLEKFVVIAAHLGTAVFVYLIAKRLKPGREVFAFVAYAWNPVVILFTAVDGHNDSVLLLFVMGAVYTGLNRQWGWALSLMTMGTLIKFVPAVLFPLFLYAGRREPRRLAIGLAASAVLAAVTFAPFWAGIDTFDAVRDQASRSTSSPATLLKYLVPDGSVRVITTLLFALGYLAVLRYVRGLAQGAFAVLLLYLLAASSWTKGWYLIWTIATAASFGGIGFIAAVLAAAGAFLAPLFGGWGWMNNWFDWQQRWGMPAMEIALTAGTYAGWLLLPLWLLWKRARRAPPTA